MTDHVESTAEEIGTEVAMVEHALPAPSQTLFRTDDPVEVVQRATKAADALKSVITQKGMVQNIKGREHVLVAGWQTLGSMLGVVPVVAWTRPLENGWEARVEARTLDGRVVGAAEAMCTRDESTWKKRDDFALRSMAQTRATSKALRGPLGFVVTLAGYSDTPAEEMPSDATEAPSRPSRVKDVEVVGGSDIPKEPLPELNEITPETYKEIQAAFNEAGRPVGYVEAWLDQNSVPWNNGGLAERISKLEADLGAKLLADLKDHEPAD